MGDAIFANDEVSGSPVLHFQTLAPFQSRKTATFLEREWNVRRSGGSPQTLFSRDSGLLVLSGEVTSAVFSAVTPVSGSLRALTMVEAISPLLRSHSCEQISITNPRVVQ
jgi:hypothetical protein